VEVGSLSRTLALDRGHGYAREEYAKKKEKERNSLLGVYKYRSRDEGSYRVDETKNYGYDASELA